MISVKFDSKSKRTLKLISQLNGRVASIEKQFPYEVAESLLASIEVPDFDYSTEYRNALRIGKVVGGSKDIASMYAVYAEVKKTRKVVASSTGLIYFINKRRGLYTRNKISDILVKHSPWTLDTVPVLPKDRNIRTVIRIGTEKEVLYIRKQLQLSSSDWRKDLSNAGVRTFRRHDWELMRRLKIEPDLQFMAMRFEFGIGTKKGRSHWRPAVKYVKKAITTDRKFTKGLMLKALSDPGFNRWKKWPSRARIISTKRAKMFVPFQNRLGVRS